MPVDPFELIDRFYSGNTPLRELLLAHSVQVRDKALDIASSPACQALPLDLEIVKNGALLHDIGVFRCHAPDIFCTGSAPYIAHGVIGAELLRTLGAAEHLDLEPYARICERHTWSGLAAAEIAARRLPLPHRDFLPETLEEKLICLADKFFSKSGDRREKTTPRIREIMAEFGEAALERFNDLCKTFHVG